ncbi:MULTISPECIES: lipopolysaccharide biosynthesis protein [unclassified Arthrobacter]|uniref:lipopolysaccharide biosynthesis protein n=1 Tax=unclassified Arthrobacter TaxID=235627 RepID=UPI002E0AAE4A|nr:MULTISPECIES: oligosaccharide flippase family protein [unclassified Arthrobacter]MEC5191552.1 O-antigen/teichoic acid export membrane protein [Arthrobacter sp. MP_M4]MEC5203154.1 O-antigen/teichoic acid export membrane protein [Arthrobacter sp. MP_M7]
MVAEHTPETKGGIASPRSAILYLIGSLVQGLGLLLIQPFAIRLLDPAQWGLVSTSVVTIQVVVVLISAGLPLAISRLWFDRTNGQARSRAMYGFLALTALLLGVAAALVAALVSRNPDGSVAWPAVLSMLAIGLLGTVLGAQAVLRAQNRPLAFVALSLVSSVAANLAGLAAILLTSASATNYLVAYTVAVASAAALALILVKPKAPWRVEGVLRESIGIALPLLPHTGALMLLTQGAVLMLAFLSGAVAAGQFGAVLIFVLGPLTLLNALNNAWSTRLMESRAGELPALLRKVATEALLASAAIGLLASAAASAGSIVLTASPEALAPVARILPLVSVGYGLFLIATNVVYILEKTRSMAYTTPLVLILMAAIAAPFAASGYLEVVAAIQAAGFTLLGVAYWLVVKGKTPASWPVGLFIILLAVHLGAVAVLSTLAPSLVGGAIEIAVVALLILAAGYIKVKRFQPA